VVTVTQLSGVLRNIVVILDGTDDFLVLKDCPSLARRNTFVDPVVFCLWEGDVCHSFCYRKPATVSGGELGGSAARRFFRVCY
jgi:hypothetical protein